jgi:nitrite reductase/ring-hydroxylating ferredoxin subunit
VNDEYNNICNLSELTETQGKRFIINDVEIAVFKIKTEVFVLSNICPHQHTALIYDGFIEDGCVVCPAHGWMFNLRTGKQPSGASGLKSFPVKIINNEVYSLVQKKELKW